MLQENCPGLKQSVWITLSALQTLRLCRIPDLYLVSQPTSQDILVFNVSKMLGKKFQLKMLNKFGKSWSNFTSFAAFWRRAVQSSHWLNCTKHETSRKSHRFVECKIEQKCTFLDVKHKDWNVCFRLKFTLTTIVVMLLMMNFTERLLQKVAKTSEQMWINWLEMYSCLWPEKFGFSDVKKRDSNVC